MPVLFRCFQCNQVLKTSRAKAGAVVACPKCGVELLVPEPTAQTPRTEEVNALGNAAGSSASAPSASASAVLADFPDIRPEDIRVQIDVDMKAPAPTRRAPRGADAAPELTIDPAAFTAEPPAQVKTAPELPPDLQIEPLPIREQTRPAWMPAAAPARPSAPSSRPSLPVPLPTLADDDTSPSPEPAAPQVRAETSLLDRFSAARPRDIILPRAAVMGWSMFAILALAMTFLAGLLAGHFLWVVKVVRTTM